MAFKKGDPKPPNSGKKKGSKNLRTELKQIKLEQGLASNGVQISEQLALAILAKDVDLIKAIASVLPYLAPRLTPTEVPDTNQPAENEELAEKPNLTVISNDRLTELLKKPHGNDAG